MLSSSCGFERERGRKGDRRVRERRFAVPFMEVYSLIFAVGRVTAPERELYNVDHDQNVKQAICLASFCVLCAVKNILKL